VGVPSGPVNTSGLLGLGTCPCSVSCPTMAPLIVNVIPLSFPPEVIITLYPAPSLATTGLVLSNIRALGYTPPVTVAAVLKM